MRSLGTRRWRRVHSTPTRQDARKTAGGHLADDSGGKVLFGGVGEIIVPVARIHKFGEPLISDRRRQSATRTRAYLCLLAARQLAANPDRRTGEANSVSAYLMFAASARTLIILVTACTYFIPDAKRFSYQSGFSFSPGVIPHAISVSSLCSHVTRRSSRYHTPEFLLDNAQPTPNGNVVFGRLGKSRDFDALPEQHAMARTAEMEHPTDPTQTVSAHPCPPVSLRPHPS